MRISQRVYRLFLRIYPAEFRVRHETDMVEMFRDGLRDRRETGRSLMGLWWKAVRDLVVTGLAMRFSRATQNSGRSTHTYENRQRRRRTRVWRNGVEEALVDARFAIRTLLRNKGFATVAVLTIALGIGANSAIFSVVSSVLMRPLPDRDAARLVVVWTRFTNDNQPTFPVSPAEYIDYRAETTAFEDMGAFGTSTATVTDDDGAERIGVASVTASLVDVLGHRAAVGRTIGVEEDRPGAGRFVVLSHGYWTRHFGADPRVVGTQLRMDGADLEIIGVMERGTALPGASVDVMVPSQFDRAGITNRSGHWLTVIARLAPGSTIEGATAELDLMLAGWADVYAGQHTPEPTRHPRKLVALDDQILGDVRPAMFVLVGAVGLVLLLVCTNVANLLLARGESRRREIGVRTALGAGRARIAKQLLTESVMLAVVGGVVGLLLGTVGVDLLLKMDPGGIPRLSEVSLDARVATFTAAVSIATGILFGVLPAAGAARIDVAAMLNTEGRSETMGRSGSRTLSGLAVAQVALAVLLLIGAGLLIKSLSYLQRVNPGFVSEHRLAFDVSLPSRSYPEREDVLGYYDAITSEIAALPGVSSVALVRNLPMRTSSRTEGMLIEGKQPGPTGEALSIQYQGASPGYFSTLGVPVLRGRAFLDSDRLGAPPVAVINESARRAYWGDENPVGTRIYAIWAGRDYDWIAVVGVVGDVRQSGLSAATRPEIYLPAAQTPPSSFGWIRNASIVVSASVEPESLFPVVRAAVGRIDQSIPVVNLQSFERVVADTLLRDRFFTMLLSIFAAAALIIASVGVYGVIAFSVARRTKEIGIRMALGAQQQQLLREVLGTAAKMAGVGATIGLAVALATSRVLESQLYGVSVRDVYVFTASAAVLVIVALAASLVPAYRASRVDPNTSLREQ